MADRLTCCQLWWKISVVNWWQHGGREALHRVGLSAAAQTWCSYCLIGLFLGLNQDGPDPGMRTFGQYEQAFSC